MAHESYTDCEVQKKGESNKFTGPKQFSDGKQALN